MIHATISSLKLSKTVLLAALIVASGVLPPLKAMEQPKRSDAEIEKEIREYFSEPLTGGQAFLYLTAVEYAIDQNKQSFETQTANEKVSKYESQYEAQLDRACYFVARKNKSDISAHLNDNSANSIYCEALRFAYTLKYTENIDEMDCVNFLGKLELETNFVDFFQRLKNGEFKL